jgi:hypothetical protein
MTPIPAFALRNLRKSIAAGLLVSTLSTAFFHAGPVQAGDILPTIDFKGLLDLRGAISSATQSAEDRGLGKTRYGADSNGNRRALGRLGQATLVIAPRITWDLSGYIVLNAAQEQRTAVDVVEAFLQYKPAPTGTWSVEARAGLFYPQVSLENTGLGWTSPYTITPSAINSWIGQEVRTTGGELTIAHNSGDLRLAATAAAFWFNDPTGTLLAWRGWSFNDRQTGIMDRLKLPLVRIIRPGATLNEQDPFDRPFKEIDHNTGWYFGATADYAGYGSLSVMSYNNHADDRDIRDGQWAWKTKFWSFALKTELPGDIDLLAQGMTGSTTVIAIPVIGPIVGVGFDSAYALVSKGGDNHRISFRADWFKTRDWDRTMVRFKDNNDEDGYALTLAYIYRPAPKQRITFEILYVDSRRPERQFQGLPIRARESQFQVSYRFFL